VSLPTYPPPPSVSELAAAEELILDRWQRDGIFEMSLGKDAPKGPFVFFEGPPTANNIPHVGHALTRTVKDLFPRFRTMQGYRVQRKAGWDTHGLPVEISIEKELGFTDKHAVEAYGIEPFNQKCYESVRRYEREWVRASERLGFWLDYDGAYFTFENSYIESVWWILGQMFDQDMLYEGHKVLPYCPLCGTTHSSHEVAQAYQDVKDPSITVALRLLPDQECDRHAFGDQASILVWTTTPWTLPSNMAACVHPEHSYVLVESKAHPGRTYLIARDMAAPVDELVDGKPFDLRSQPALATFSGSDLEGLRYTPLFDFTGNGTEAETQPGETWSVVVDPYVTLESGTGIVHVAPAFGEDDHRIGKAYGLPLYCALETDGRFKDHTGALAGKWFKDADIDILTDLKARGQLVRSEKYEHSYPHCWRHGTPLYYVATSSWFVRTTAMKDDLVAGNQTIDWTPSHIRDGRFGKWLDGVVDWALSRKRYWGTPLPIWRCADCGALECMSSFAELFERWGKPLPQDPYAREQWNPHRPYVDDIHFGCTSCPGTMSRVTEVIDCWFDAGAMPFAQHHYPFTEASRQLIDEGEGFPADFISEAVDQTRGWFYTLHVISTFLKKRPAYKTCVVLGHVLDESGKKMSKSIGNVLPPGPIIDQFGADAFRWFFYRSGVTQPSRFSANMVRDSLKNYLLPLLNAWSFFTIYASIDGFAPDSAERPDPDSRPPLDRWVLSTLSETTEAVTEALESNQIATATAALESFIDGLTNWYIRRSRRRFWSAKGGTGDADKHAAYQTLWEVLTTVAKLSAPFTPFLSDRMHQDLVRPFVAGAPLSIHLDSWPDAGPVDAEVLQRMGGARRAANLGHGARQEASVGVRQPLRRATIVSVDPGLLEALADPATQAVVREELNVRELNFAEDRAAYVTYEVKPNYRTLGRKLGKRMPLLAKAVAGLDPAALVAAAEAGQPVTVDLAEGDPVELAPEDFDIRIQQREGTVSSFDEGMLVALDTELDDDLLQEGLAREVINRIQGARKDLNLAYDDRIALSWQGGPEIVAALEIHAGLVAGEVLASSITCAPHPQARTESIRDEKLSFHIEVSP
jgi:isoleucyl-tRNA synthetase